MSDEVRPASAGARSSSPLTEGEVPSFQEQFKAFAKFGDSKSAGEAITLSNSDKWFKQSKVIDGKKVTTVDTGIYFKKIAKYVANTDEKTVVTLQSCFLECGCILILFS